MKNRTKQKIVARLLSLLSFHLLHHPFAAATAAAADVPFRSLQGGDFPPLFSIDRHTPLQDLVVPDSWSRRFAVMTEPNHLVSNIHDQGIVLFQVIARRERNSVNQLL
jgi:hypothetical protein